MLRLFSIVAVLTCISAWPAAGADAAALRSTESALIRAINDVRADHGLQRLRADTTLVRVARAHSTRIARAGALFHGGLHHVRARRVGENLAWTPVGDFSARWIVRKWLASPSHRANLLGAGFRRVGVGSSRGRSLLYFTAEFASLR